MSTKQRITGLAFICVILISLSYIGCDKEKEIVSYTHPEQLDSMSFASLSVSGDLQLLNTDTIGSGIVWYGGLSGSQKYYARVWQQGNLCFHSTTDDYPTLWLGQNRRVGIGLVEREPAYTLDVEGEIRATENITANHITSNQRLFVNSGGIYIEEGAVPFIFRETGASGQGSYWRMALDAREIRFDASNSSGFDPYETALTLVGNGDVWVGGNIYAANISSPSDSRWKKNIKGIDNSLNLLCQLHGVKFDWNQDKIGHKKFAGGTQLGLIAQEVKEIIPEVVSEDDDGYNYIAYSKLVPVLIEAIKEQQVMIEKLQRQVTEITGAKENLSTN